MNCQLACPSCPTASGATDKALGSGHLSVERFHELLDGNPQIAEVELSNYGEMFLNPRLVEIMRIAHERTVVLHADNGVNLNHASDETLEALVRYQFRSIRCSIDGANPETYSRYRVKGNFERVIGHIRKINSYKRQLRSGFPILRWQYIVFGHNEHEIEAARKLAAELGMELDLKLSWDPEFSPIRDRELVQIQLGGGSLTREEHYQSTGRDYMRAICYQLWRAPVLNWDGRVVGCCRNFWGDFGANAFTDGLIASVNNEKMRHARAMLMGNAEERSDLPCTTCELYQTLKRDGQWLQEDEIKEPDRRPGIQVSIVPIPASSDVTQIGVAVLARHEMASLVQRMSLRLNWSRQNPARVQNFAVGSSFSIRTKLEPGEYTICAFPLRADRKAWTRYLPQPLVTLPIRVAERPLAQEFQIIA